MYSDNNEIKYKTLRENRLDSSFNKINQIYNNYKKINNYNNHALDTNNSNLYKTSEFKWSKLSHESKLNTNLKNHLLLKNSDLNCSKLRLNLNINQVKNNIDKKIEDWKNSSRN